MVIKMKALSNIEVCEIDKKLSHDFILNKHYAQRLPSISWCFGLFIDGSLEGVLTIGKPASNALCDGICGKDFKSYVYELNRLIVNADLPKNTLSMFVSKVIKLLKKENLILVSYADEGVGHQGYIYQATNFIYTGKTKERTDKYTEVGKHSRHYNNENNHLRKFRSSKHRYVYFVGKMKSVFIENLNYSVEEYPKGVNSKYILGDRVKDKIINKDTGEIFYQ